MAQGSSGGKPTGPKNNKGSSGGSSANSAASKPAASKPAKGKQQSISRKSVAQARTSNTNNRTQLIIGAVAIVVIAAIIIIGIVMNQKATQVQNAGYGASTKSVATESGGVVTVSNPTAAAGTSPKVIDLYEDALCPVCAEFEAQFGQQLNQAVDEGKLTVNVHMLTFLDPRSFSTNYSTRAAAALLCVAQQDGSQPGVYLGLHSALFASGTQPTEGGSADLTDQQLADLATSKGASDAAAQCITSAQNVAAATAADTSSSATLSAATGGRVGTPTVVQNGKPVDIQPPDWLTTLLAQP